MKIKLLFSSIFFSLLLSISVLSHDYWLEPQNFFVSAQSGKVNVRMFLGENLQSEAERPLQKDRTLRFQMYSLTGTKDLLTSTPDNQTPVAQVTFDKEGNYLFAMERKAATIKLDAVKFKEYLNEEGLQSIIAERERTGENNKEGRERYSRYLKTLVQVGARHDDAFKREVGHRLEIIPQTNPYSLKIGNKLDVRLLFEGKPLKGASIFAQNREAGKAGMKTATTDDSGIASFSIDKPGAWSIRVVHMRRCAGAVCSEIDWESFWSAYTFGIK